MTISNIIAEIDSQIAALVKAKELLTGTTGRATRATKNTSTASSAGPKPKRKRKLTAEGRARIAEAQRKRWAAKKAKLK